MAMIHQVAPAVCDSLHLLCRERQNGEKSGSHVWLGSQRGICIRKGPFKRMVVIHPGVGDLRAPLNLKRTADVDGLVALRQPSPASQHQVHYSTLSLCFDLGWPATYICVRRGSLATYLFWEEGKKEKYMYIANNGNRKK